jgi:hypothetical protein
MVKEKEKKNKTKGWKPSSKVIFKKDKPATVTYRGSNPNSHFKKEWEQEGKFLSWK